MIMEGIDTYTINSIDIDIGIAIENMEQTSPFQTYTLH